MPSGTPKPSESPSAPSVEVWKSDNTKTSRLSCPASSRSAAARATAGTSSAAPDDVSIWATPSSAGPGCVKAARESNSAAPVGTRYSSSPGWSVSASAAASSFACWSSSPWLSRSVIDGDVSTTTAIAAGARPANTPAHALSTTGRAKATTRPRMASVRSASSSHCRMRSRCIAFCWSPRTSWSDENSTSFGFRKWNRWTRIGMAAAASPSSRNGLRNVIGSGCGGRTYGRCRSVSAQIR